MRLIDADELKRLGYVLTRTYPKDPQTMVYETKNIEDIPTIDPVKHGRWEYDGPGDDDCHAEYRCSNCGALASFHRKYDAITDHACP